MTTKSKYRKLFPIFNDETLRRTIGRRYPDRDDYLDLESEIKVTEGKLKRNQHVIEQLEKADQYYHQRYHKRLAKNIRQAKRLNKPLLENLSKLRESIKRPYEQYKIDLKNEIIYLEKGKNFFLEKISKEADRRDVGHFEDQVLDIIKKIKKLEQERDNLPDFHFQEEEKRRSTKRKRK